MKKILNGMLGMLVIVGFVVLLGIAGYIETHYTMECEVVKIEGNVITLEDKVGYLWEVEDENLEMNKIYKVEFSTNDTTNRTDDKIIKIK